MIDLHCHLLPGTDDGPRTLEDALAMADALIAAGVERVAATPHVSATYPTTSAAIASGCAALSDELARRRVPLRVVAGAEVDLLQALELRPGELERLQLGGAGTLLVECPFVAVAPTFEAGVRELQAQGHRVLLGHPERSPAFLREPELLRRLVRAGALVSLTASALAGSFGRTSRRYARWALEERLAHDVASDAHDVRRRPPGLRDEIDAAGFGWARDWLTQEVPAAILAGTPVPRRPAAPVRSPLSRLRRRLQHGP